MNILLACGSVGEGIIRQLESTETINPVLYTDDIKKLAANLEKDHVYHEACIITPHAFQNDGVINEDLMNDCFLALQKKGDIFPDFRIIFISKSDEEMDLFFTYFPLVGNREAYKVEKLNLVTLLKILSKDYDSLPVEPTRMVTPETLVKSLIEDFPEDVIKETKNNRKLEIPFKLPTKEGVVSFNPFTKKKMKEESVTVSKKEEEYVEPELEEVEEVEEVEDFEEIKIIEKENSVPTATPKEDDIKPISDSSFLKNTKNLRKVLLFSGDRRSGSTTSAIGYAKTLAAQGNTVIYLDLDLNRRGGYFYSPLRDLAENNQYSEALIQCVLNRELINSKLLFKDGVGFLGNSIFMDDALTEKIKTKPWDIINLILSLNMDYHYVVVDIPQDILFLVPDITSVATDIIITTSINEKEVCLLADLLTEQNYDTVNNYRNLLLKILFLIREDVKPQPIFGNTYNKKTFAGAVESLYSIDLARDFAVGFPKISNVNLVTKKELSEISHYINWM